MTQMDWVLFFRATCVSNKKNCFSCITSLKIHHQLENHRKELFSSKLHWEIFCCINSCDYNSTTRLGHVTPPESKMAEKGSNVSHCSDFVSFHLYSLLYWSFFSLSLNRPFPNYLWGLFQSESWCMLIFSYENQFVRNS